VFIGAAGLVGFGVILGPIALGLGVLALGETRRHGGPGKATAIIGIVLGVTAFTVAIVLSSAR
jgi:Domain of unknown function (DUF4190)